jgi:16S rRNA (guanine527-N7)-methyltransferase
VEPMWLIENVFLDSLCFLEALPSAARRLADVGSGAGIPGIPIAIVSPGLEVDLIESRQRRVSFLSTAVRELALPRVRVVGARVEDLATSHAELFDVVTMRCAGEIRTLVPRVLPLLRPGGTLIVSAKPGSGDGGNLVVVSTRSGRPRSFRCFVKPFSST